MDDFREANGAILEDYPSSSLLWSGPTPLCFGPEDWAPAERVTHEIISQVQPTVVSEERRRVVIDYVQRLIRDRIGCEVFPFGSVPLKTYLPDGDIDLTAFCDFNSEETLATDVCSVLEAEDHNPAAEFVVKDVQYIHAEVKLVKCLVQNIVVDISFNQIGGLCTLCFLEQVDLKIGKDHLFKRSIILIKAWCYYESRILGAHHGLLSTYALEMLVLYIFHHFHASLNGPLEVLYKFLDYYSKFDWENFCVSLNGPIHMSLLPELVAERPADLLFSSDFFKECVEVFSVPWKGNEAISKVFIQKHINIVDPLRDFNNLGRSVSKGNFFRIRSAISFGARKLGRILSQEEEENITEEVRKFFANTLDRHGRGQRPDVEDPNPGESFPNGLSYDMQHDTLDQGWECISSGCASDEHGVNLHRARQGAKDAGISASGSHCTNDTGANKVQVPCQTDDVHGFSLTNVESRFPLWSPPLSEDASFSMGPLPSNGEYIMGSHQEIERHETLSDLAGDFESHIYNWQYGRWWYNHASGTPLQGNTPPPSLLRKNPWETTLHSVHPRQKRFSNVHTNGVIPRPPFFFMSPVRLPGGATFGMELSKARGTGMYFPNTNHQFYRERSTLMKPSKTHRFSDRGFGSPDKSQVNDNSFEPLQMQSSVRQGNWKPLVSDSRDSSSPGGKAPKGANGLSASLEKSAEFGPPGHRPPDSVWLESSWRTSSGAVPDQNSGSGPSSSEGHAGEPVFVVKADWFAARSYHLKDEEDFPPLSI